jgi:hypothetical protein
MSYADLVSQFWLYMNKKEWEFARKLLDPQFVAEWPQSRVRFKGAHHFMLMNENYPGNHEIKIINIYDCNNKIISEVEIKSKMPDGIDMHLYAISFFEVLDYKIMKAVEYWADTYDAPKWQEQWCEYY